jgi:hypothetical protein
MSQLRKLRLFIVDSRKINNMPLVYDIKTDPRYLEGREATLKEAIREMLKDGLSRVKIAKYLKVSVDFIEEVEKSR